ncbi:MAG: hypothetical protein H6592_06215 [Flavobacteriales bacterium]|nr:hypothetical protein [Flavobacteriales bacterium]
MDDLTKGFVFTALGIVLAWILSAVSDLTKHRYQRKRGLRRVVFQLLELDHILKSTRPDDGIDKYAEKAFTLMSPIEQANMPLADLKNILTTEIQRINLAMVQVNLVDMKAAYEETIGELSFIDPISAYRLKGRTKVLEFLDHVKGEVDGMVRKYGGSAMDVHVIGHVMDKQAVPMRLEDDIKTLEEHLRRTAWRAGWVLGFRVWRRLTRADNPDQEIGAKIDAILAALKDQMHGLHQNVQPQTMN